MTESNGTPARRQFSLEELEPLIREAFADGKGFWLPVTGTSNLPTLAPGRDEIILGRVDQPLRKRELPLYRRDSGQYVLHRIVSVQKDGTYSCCGDHQWVKEPGIRPDQIIGRVVRITRKGKSFSVDSAFYQAWVRIWVLLFPCRSFLIRSCHALIRFKQKLSPPKTITHVIQLSSSRK